MINVFLANWIEFPSCRGEQLFRFNFNLLIEKKNASLAFRHFLFRILWATMPFPLCHLSAAGACFSRRSILEL